MQQVTIQDLRDAFGDEDLPLTTIKTHRYILQVFAKHRKALNLNLTTRNVFDYLMFNANVKASSVTFGEVSDVDYSEIAKYLKVKENTIAKEIVKLCSCGLLERHPSKRKVFIIPTIMKARDDLAEQATMKKEIRITEQAETRISKLEEEGVIITHDIRRRVYADAMKANGNHQKNGNHQEKLPFE